MKESSEERKCNYSFTAKKEEFILEIEIEKNYIKKDNFFK